MMHILMQKELAPVHFDGISLMNTQVITSNIVEEMG